MREQREHDEQMRQQQWEHDKNTRLEMELKLYEQLQANRAERAESDAKLEQYRQEMEAKFERQRHGLEQLQMQDAASKLRGKELAALQARLGSLHGAKLLSDEELWKFEDIIADSMLVETAAADGGELEGASADVEVQVAQLIMLAERLTGDAMLARQLRRKFT